VLDHALLAEGSQLDNPAEYVQRINEFMLGNNNGAVNE
jgi:HSP90 family molecular chaperone